IHQTYDGPPVRFAHTEDQDLAIGSLIDARRAGGAMAITHPGVRLAFEFVGNQAGHRGNCHIHHRHFDFLSPSCAAPLDECGEYSTHQMAASPHVDTGSWRAGARTIGKSGDRDKSRGSLNGAVHSSQLRPWSI